MTDTTLDHLILILEHIEDKQKVFTVEALLRLFKAVQDRTGLVISVSPPDTVISVKQN